MVKVTLGAFVDWSNDGDFADTGEDVTARVLNEPGVTWERGRDQLRALAPPMAGAASFALNNASKDYSPANTGGPLYGNLVPGRAVRLQLDGTDMWRGNVDDLPQEPWLRGGGRVRVPALGLLAKLKGKKVSTDLYPNGAFPTLTTNDAIGLVFTALGLGAKFTALDTGKTTLVAWWCNEDDAFEMVVKLLAAEGPGAALYETAAGLVAFHSRHYRLINARCTTSQATFGNATTEPKHSPPFGYQPNLKGVVNSCAIAQSTLVIAGSVTTLWTYGGAAYELGPGASRSYDVALAAPGQGALSIVATATLSGGAPASLTSTLKRFDPATGTYVTASSGTRFRLTLTNASASIATIATLRLDGYATTTVTDTATQTIDASASITKYGPQALATNWQPWPYIDRLVAADFCDAIVSSYQEPRATVTVTLKNHNATRVTQQLARDISDRITVQEGQTGISGPAIIERVRHTVSAGGRFYTTEFGCEVVGTQADWFIWDVSVFDTGRWGF